MTTERQRAEWWERGWDRMDLRYWLRSDPRWRYVSKRLQAARKRLREKGRVGGANGGGGAPTGGLGAARVVGKK